MWDCMIVKSEQFLVSYSSFSDITLHHVADLGQIGNTAYRVLVGRATAWNMPKMRLQDNIKMGCDQLKCIEPPRNRTQWRQFVC